MAAPMRCCGPASRVRLACSASSAAAATTMSAWRTSPRPRSSSAWSVCSAMAPALPVWPPRRAHNSRASSHGLLAPYRSARRRSPLLRCFIPFGVAIKRHLEIAAGDDEAGPAVDKSDLENIVLQERPNAVAERARHRDALMRELGRAQRRVAVYLSDDFFQIAERVLPDRVAQCADRLAAENFVAFVDRLERVTDAPFAKQ